MDDLAVAYPPPAAPVPVKPPRRVLRRTFAALGVLVVVSGFGPALGWLWTRLAPRLPVIKVEGGFAYAESEPEQLVGAEATYAFLAVGAGLVLAVLAWMILRRDRGWVVLAALTVGSLVSAWLAWYLGYKIGIGQLREAATRAPNGTHLEALLGLRMTDLDPQQLWPPKVTGVVAIQALVAAFVYTIIAGFSVHPDLRKPRPPTDAELAELYAYGAPVYQDPYPTYPPPPASSDPFPPSAPPSALPPSALPSSVPFPPSAPPSALPPSALPPSALPPSALPPPAPFPPSAPLPPPSALPPPSSPPPGPPTPR